MNSKIGKAREYCRWISLCCATHRTRDSFSWELETKVPQKQARFVSVKAERPLPSRHVTTAMWSCDTTTWQHNAGLDVPLQAWLPSRVKLGVPWGGGSPPPRHIHDSIRPNLSHWAGKGTKVSEKVRGKMSWQTFPGKLASGLKTLHEMHALWVSTKSVLGHHPWESCTCQCRGHCVALGITLQHRLSLGGQVVLGGGKCSQMLPF